MYNDVTQEFIDRIKVPGRKFEVKISTEDGIDITNGFKSISISGLSGSDTSTIEIGTATASQLDVVMENNGVFITGKEFQLFIGIYTDVDETVLEYVPIGVFTAQKPTIERNKISFTSYDRMTSRMSNEYISQLTYPCDMFDVLTEIENMSGIFIVNKPRGITINQRVQTDDGETVIYCNPFDTYSYRDAVALIAGIFGSFATFNRFGNLEFRDFTEQSYEICYLTNKSGNVLTDSNGAAFYVNGDSLNTSNEISVDQNQLYNGMTLSNETYKLGYIQCTVDEDNILYSGSVGNTGIAMENFLMTQELLDNVYSKLESLEYNPITLSFIGDLRLDIGDIITVQNYDGTSYKMPIMGLNIAYDGGLKYDIGSYGDSEQSGSSYVGPTQMAIQRVANDLYYIKKLIASQIYVDDLFAKDIKATGTIEGATLKGASGEFTKSFKVSTPYDEENNFDLSVGGDGVEFGVSYVGEDDSEEPDPFRLANEAYFKMKDGILYYYAYNSMYFTIAGGRSNFSISMGDEEMMSMSPMSDGVTIYKDLVVYGSTRLAGTAYLGSSGSTLITSDENLKELVTIDEKFDGFFKNLNPVAYKYKELGKKKFHRKHIGFSAQEVESALNSAGLTTEDFAGVCIDNDVIIPKGEYETEDDIHFDELYSLRYEEFIALNTRMIQKLQEENESLKDRISTLEEKVERLLEK